MCVCPRQLCLPADWFGTLSGVLGHVRQHAAFSLLRTYIGGWTTSVRMGEEEKLPCIFGCREARDELTHYLLCAPLWLIASEALRVETPFSLGERLCLVSPSPEHVQLLALAFQIYHGTKSRSKELGGPIFLGSNRVQLIAAESARAFIGHAR